MPVRRSAWPPRLPQGGDSFAALAVLAVVGAALGALVGWVVASPVTGAGIGLVVAGCLWFVLVLRAFRAEAAASRSGGRHRRPRP